MARILLLGGTGAMGVYLREILAEREDEVYITSRSHRDDDRRIRYLEGDAHELDFLKQAVAITKPDAIVDFMIYYTEEFKRRVQTLLCLSQQYVFISSYRVFAEQIPLTERSPRLLDVIEDAEYLKTDEYALTKARQEDLLRASGKTNWTIVRPAITYSKERFQFGVLEESMMEKQTTMTWGRDVARMIAGLIGNPNAFGEDFNCATAEHHTWSEVARIYHQTIGLRVELCSIDDYVRGANKYQVMYDRMLNRVLDNSKILKTIGMEQSSLTKLEDGLSRELTVFMHNPRFHSFDLARNVYMDCITGTRIPLRDLSSQDRWGYLKSRYLRVGRLLSLIGRGLRKKHVRK